MADQWDGKDRRRENRDHDVLTRIDVNLSNFMTRFEEHTVDDKSSFDKMEKAFEKLDERTKILENFKIKFVAVVAAIVFAVELFLKKIWR